MLKIAVWYNLPSGGAKRALHDKVSGFLAHGHTVELWRPPHTDAAYMDVSALAPEHVVPLAQDSEDSKFYPRRIYLASRRAESSAVAMERHSQACAEQIDAGKFDVVFCDTDELFHAPFIGRYLKTPRLLYLHEPNRPVFEAMPRLPWLLPEIPPDAGLASKFRARARAWIELRNARVFGTFEIENAAHYDRILVNSRYSREAVLRSYGLESTVCYPGVDTSRFRDPSLPRERFVTTVGALLPAKNPELLIRALAHMSGAERPPLVWIYNFAASAEYEAEVLALARACGVELKARKMISDDELVDLLNRTSAFVYAPRLEPLGAAPLEAGACGAPVVAVAEAGVRETVEDGINGLLTDANPESIAGGIRALLNDQALARRLGERGVKEVQSNWSAEAAAERLERHLLEVAGQV